MMRLTSGSQLKLYSKSIT